tara:strand:+ start:9368 stop:10051 length:684 start_codon:yes stop_codon:yes gene_type:complete
MNLDFSNKVVLVTGATRGIGKCISDDFKSLGAEVVSYPSSTYDLTNGKELNDFVKLLETLRIDVCVNNAGINKINYVEDVLEEDYDKIMHINTKAPFMISKAVSKSMKDRGYGRIINIASIFGHCTKEKRSCYTTSKFALVGMTKTLAVEMAAHNVLVNCVSPGFTATELTTRILGTKGISEMCEQVPMKRMAAPEEISKVVLFLASEYNTYLTGQNLIVDGGFVNV